MPRLGKEILEIRKGFIGIFVVLILIFLIVPLFTVSLYTYVTFQTLFTLLIVFTIATLSDKKADVIGGIALAIPFVIFDFISSMLNSLNYMIVAYGFYCIFLLFAVVILVRRVLVKPSIDTNLIFGVITIYMLTGIIWSKIYFLINAFIPNSFHGIQSLDYKNFTLHQAYVVHFDLLYFSFTTLSTLGMGDIAPTHRLSQSFTLLEAMFGQLFVATVIAKVVSVWHKR